MPRALVFTLVALSARSVRANADASAPHFTFSAENFRDPKLPHGLCVRDVPLMQATEENLRGYGRLISSADEVIALH